MNILSLVIRIIISFADLAVAGMGVTVSTSKEKIFYPIYIHKSM